MKITLRAARVNAGYSQKDVASLLRKSNKTIGLWENGQASMDAANFIVLCDLYKVNADDIILPEKSAKSEQKEAM